jgi:hypothetical protein
MNRDIRTLELSRDTQIPNPDIENDRTTSKDSLGIFFQSADIVSVKLAAQLQKQPKTVAILS